MELPNQSKVLKAALYYSLSCLLALVVPIARAQVEPTATAHTDFSTIIAIAESKSRTEFKDATSNLSSSWKAINYDQYRAIRFKSQASLWRGESDFELQFFHPGFLYHRMPSIMRVRSDGQASEQQFDPSFFSYDFPELKDLDKNNLGFAGFRAHYPLHTTEYKDEFLVFLGASYFRLLSRGQGYGLSARGLALNTGHEHGEEFPYFSQFWMVTPEKNSQQLKFWALLESTSVVGAFEFTVTPDTVSEMEVHQVLFFRRPVDKVGIAPLTSMFFYGENRERQYDDFRPEVHDSDGLLVHTKSGEWLWRPLSDHWSLSISSFFDEDIQGFGLLQRDRDFNSYQDLDSNYHRRPSYWIEPIGSWGRGKVELVELPTISEANDNVVAYWIPEEKVSSNGKAEFRYRMRSFSNPGTISPRVLVTSTRIGSTKLVGQNQGSNRERKFVLEFKGEDLKYIKDDLLVLADIWSSSGKILNVVSHKSTMTNGWRVVFELEPENDKPVELRAFLKIGPKTISETWSYLWTPQ